MHKILFPRPRSTTMKLWFWKVSKLQVCQQQTQNVQSAETTVQPGGSGSSGLQTSPKPVSSNVRNADLPGENTTEIRLFFYTALEKHTSRKSEFIRSELLSCFKQSLKPSCFRTKIYIVTGSLNLMIFPIPNSHLSVFGKFSLQID